MMDTGQLTLAALLLPALSFLILATAVPLRRSGRPAAYLSVVAAALSLGAAATAWLTGSGEPTRLAWEWLPARAAPLATIGIVADAAPAVMLVLVALVAFLVQAYSLGYLDQEPPAALGRYYTYQSLFAFSMMGLVLAPNLLQLFICWELVGLCSYLLIGFWYRKPEAARAALKAFWTTKAGDVGLLVGIVLLWRRTGTFDLASLQLMAANGDIALAGLSAVTFCIYLGAMGKSAQFPLHIWLPDAMEGPTPVSALIHAATMVTAGVYLLHRTAWLFALTPDVLIVVAWIGAFTALLAAVLACVQDDIKRVLAYSTVSQLGYMMTAIGAGGSTAGFFHLLTHGVFKALLFLGAGAIIHAVGSNDLSRMGGLWRRMPQTGIVFVIGTLSLAGVPLFAGYLSKEAILGAVWTGGLMVPFALLLFVAFLTAFYMFRVVFLAFFRNEGPSSALDAHAQHDRHDHHVPHDPPASMMLPLWGLSLLSLAIGIWTLVAGQAPLVAPAGDEAAHAPGWLAPTAVGVALAGIALAWLTYQQRTIGPDALASMFGPVRRAALARFWIDDLFDGVLAAATLALARLVGWIDRYVVDGVLNVVSAWTVAAGDRLRAMQTGRVQDYVFGLSVGVLVVLFWVQWAL
jgi:NADH-quinone oxidoreductase subunit L